MALFTEFAPAEKADAQSIIDDYNMFGNVSYLQDMINAIPDIFMILNSNRQIVFCSKSLLEMVHETDEMKILGKRPGEILNCLHAFESSGGCGTNEICKTCGAANAILTSQKGYKDIQECRINQRDEQSSLDLRVWATPFNIDSRRFTIFALMDISDEKRRRVLERIFFHDITNLAGGLKGVAELLGDELPDINMVKELIIKTTGSILDEIQAQKELSSAENNELKAHFFEINSMDLLCDVIKIYENHNVSKNRHLEIYNGSEEISFDSDITILKRILGNMIKNALEACKDFETVTIGCYRSNGNIEIWVQNPNFIPRNTQLQIFQRSFSTKGTGRGIGTYSIKLLTERYLTGKVTFDTDIDRGTIFKVSLPIKQEKTIEIVNDEIE